MALAATQRVSLAARGGDLPPDSLIFGRTGAMQVVRQKVDKVALTTVPVLIQGDSGSGKGVLARYIHGLAGPSAGPFVNVNCAAIPGTLLESELFGYEKGAFTGAYVSKPGRAELAHGGTLFLDGIDEIDLTLQAKLLQLLQDGRFSRIGGREDIIVQTRVICATTRPLDKEIAAGRFRPDLYYRINVVSVDLPPLRSRAEDIPDLAAYFLERHKTRHNSSVRAISAGLLDQFRRHSWPGNIRELENMVERYVILGSEETVCAELMQWDTQHVAPEIPANGPIHLKKVTRQAVQELERKIILSVLEANRWNRKRAASELKISYRALLYKIRHAGLPSKRMMRQPIVTAPAAVTPLRGTD